MRQVFIRWQKETCTLSIFDLHYMKKLCLFNPPNFVVHDFKSIYQRDLYLYRQTQHNLGHHKSFHLPMKWLLTWILICLWKLIIKNSVGNICNHSLSDWIFSNVIIKFHNFIDFHKVYLCESIIKLIHYWHWTAINAKWIASL